MNPEVGRWLVDFGDDWDSDRIESAVVTGSDATEAFSAALAEADYVQDPSLRTRKVPTMGRSTVTYLGGLIHTATPPGTVIHAAMHYG